MRVVAVIQKDEGTGYGISFPDFPGCISVGESLDEVVALGTEALNLHIAGMLEDGDPLPVARDIEDLRGDPEFAVDFEGAVIVTIPAFLPGRGLRHVDVVIDGDLLDEIDTAAKSFPGGRSGFMAEAAREKIVKAR